MGKRILLIVLSLSLVFMAACQSGGESSKASTENTKPQVSSSESKESGSKEMPVITVLFREFVNAPIEEDSLGIAELQKRVGVKLEFQKVAGAELDKTVALAISSDELPDLTCVTNLSTFSPYFSQGIMENLTSVLKGKMPNVYATYEEYGILKDIKQDDGSIFALAAINGQSLLTCNTGFVNVTWLEECGLTEADLPNTTDELLKLLRTFKATMTDGIPMTGGQWMNNGYTKADGAIIRAFGSDTGWRLFDNGTYTYAPYGKSEEFKNALTYLHTLYSEGLLHPEYVTLTDDDIGALVAENKVGFLNGWVDNGTYKGGNMEQYVRIGVLNRDTIGKTYVSTPAWERFVISSKSKVKEDIYRMLDYTMSKEGRLLFSWGIEGVTYEVVNGEKQYTDLVMKGDLPPLNQRRALGIQPHHFFHIWDLESAKPVLPAGTVESMIADAKYAYPQPPILSSNEAETTELTQIMTDIKSFVKQSVAEFVNGKKSIEDDFASFQEQLKKMGIERAIQIKQEQYKRYLAR